METMLVRWALVLGCALFAAPSPCDAQTLYKLIDKNGKVTYSEAPPKDFDGKVIRLDIDPNANTATLPKAAPETDGARRPGRVTAEDPVEAARQRLEAARKALAEARDNPGEGDVSRVGNKGGGARAQPSEDYQRRLAGLEGAVKVAEEDLLKAQGR